MKACTKQNRMIVAMLIVCMVLLCALYHKDGLEDVFHTGDLGWWDTQSTLSDTALHKLEETEVLEQNLILKLRISKKLERTAANRKSGSPVAFFSCLSLESLLQNLSVRTTALIVKNDLTPRYSVVLYLHRSDGKKSHLFA